ncbi:hypothetical protein Tco_1008077 [Tanacetum coccineum]
MTWSVAILSPSDWWQLFTSFPCAFLSLISQVVHTWRHPSIGRSNYPKAVKRDVLVVRKDDCRYSMSSLRRRANEKEVVKRECPGTVASHSSSLKRTVNPAWHSPGVGSSYIGVCRSVRAAATSQPIDDRVRECMPPVYTSADQCRVLAQEDDQADMDYIPGWEHYNRGGPLECSRLFLLFRCVRVALLQLFCPLPEHELELKEKLRAKYDARGVLLSEKDAEIARLKSLLKEKETEAAEVLRLRDQVSVLAAEKSSLSAEVSALKSDVSQKDTVISLLDSRASHLKSSLDDSQAACDEAKNLISSLSSEKDGLVSEVSILRSSFRDFKDKMEAQQEEQAQELYNRVAELEAHVMDVSGRLEGEFYPAYLTALAGRRWLLTHGMELAMVKCLKSPEYQGILGHALGRAVDYGMQEGLVAGHEHGIAGTPLSAVVAYDPETAKNNYFDAVRALEEADFPLIHLLKSKKDSGMDEVLDCFLLDGPLANLPEAAYLQPCLEQLSVPIYYADVNAVVGETSLSFALLNVHTRAEGAKRHASALRQLMVDIVSHPLSSQNLLGEASTSSAVPCIEDLDTGEDLGSVVCMPQFEDPRFEILPYVAVAAFIVN